MQVGMTKDQGLYDKTWAAVYPGALAAGTLPQYNTVSREVTVASVHFYGTFIYRVYNSPPSDAIVSQMDPFRTVQEHFFKVRFTDIFPCMPALGLTQPPVQWVPGLSRE